MTGATHDERPDLSRSSRTRDDRGWIDYDSILDGLLEGRLGGRAFDRVTAGLLMGLLERLEWPAHPRDFAAALPHFPDRFQINEFRATLMRMGYSSTVRRSAGRALRKIRSAALIADADGSLWFCARDRAKPVLYRPLGPEGETERSIRPWQAYRVVEFEPDHKLDPSEGPLQSRSSWTADLFFRFAPEFRLVLMLTLLSGGLAIVVAFGITMIFDIVIPTRNEETLRHLLVGLMVVFALDFSFRRIKAECIGRITARAEHIMGAGLFGKLLDLKPSLVSAAPLGTQMARLRRFEGIRDLVGSPMAQIVFELPLTLALLAVIAAMAWQLAGILVLHIMIFVSLGVMFAPGLHRETRKLGAIQVAATQMLTDVITHRGQIARYGMAPAISRKAAPVIADLARQRRRVAVYSRGLGGMAHGSLPLAAAMVIGVGAILVMNGQVTAGELIAITILTWRLLAPVQQFLAQLPRFRDVRDIMLQVDTLMQLPDDRMSSSAPAQRISEGQLQVLDVVLRHPKSVSPTLVGVRVDIPHGAFVTVTGEAGSGKSTLLKVLAGVLEPQAGAVHLNDLNIAQLSREFRAANIAYVPQHPPYFYGTVAQNLRFANPAAGTYQLEAITDELGLSQWLAELPEGLNTRLDPSRDGAVLRPDIKSCLAIAQGLLTEPVVLLLDEPVGGMNNHLESHLLQALHARRDHMTRVMVTHRPSVIRQSDAVLLLKGGGARMAKPEDLERKVS